MSKCLTAKKTSAHSSKAISLTLGGLESWFIKMFATIDAGYASKLMHEASSCQNKLFLCNKSSNIAVR